jgi:hypothetical protein
MPRHTKDFKYPPVPEENLVEVPYGSEKCKICHLPLADLKVLHQLRFGRANERMTWVQLREYLKKNYGIGNDYQYIMKHFKEHTRPDKTQLLTTSSDKPAVVDIILAKEAHLMRVGKNDETIERAFDKLVRQAAEFTEKIDIMFRALKIRFEDEKQVVEDLSKLEATALLKTLAEMNAMARSQIKDIAALRAPKRLVMQFLEDTLDKITIEVNETLRTAFSMFQDGMTKALAEKKISNLVTDATFSGIFKAVAIPYKERMIAVRREQMTRAASVLADMEKII